MLCFLISIMSGCSSQSLKSADSSEAPVQRIPEPTRDEVMGPNRAQASMKSKKGKDYAFRNIASAFPDTGKNMLLKDRALPKNNVNNALDHSPWRIQVYQNPERIKENRERFSNMNKAFYSTPLTQREAQILAQAPKQITNETFYQMETTGKEDGFEPNDDQAHAYNLSHAEERWLALVGPKETRTEGIQWNEDWYKISVSPQYKRVMIDLRFQHYLGDIDLKFFDAKGNLVGASQGTGEDEFLHLALDQGGTYFVKVYGSNRGNQYDLKYSTYFTGGGDDEYEDNDLMKKAMDLSQLQNIWIGQVNGEGVAADDDFYKIQVPAGNLRVQVDLRYDVNRGDVDMRLLNSEGKIVASSANIGDDDYIDFTVAHAGTYYIKVYPFAPQNYSNMYDLKWSAQKIASQKDASKISSNSKTSVSSANR